ncbi:unnamed protein product [Microthlaspi erraticum]|uniref:Arabidopsis retrotransposon Orf1 C-terminal domain-containing protein n=1 Tax=Microthlaspi erraticum TaxID=1685480 RepID=A0A6D2KFS4_9BRAS|nr:unnamed protein product [Microthlaspi erraticum]
MEEAEESKRRMSSPCTKSTTMLSSPWTLWRPSTHMMTHERSWIFEDVELVLKNMQLAKFFSHRMESYKELTCEFLASMKHHEFDELDRAELDQGWGSKAARSEAQCLDMSQGSCQHLLCKESHWTINEGEVKLLDMGIKPIISRTRMGRRSEEIGHTQGISCLSLSSSKPTRSQLTTLGTKEEGSLVLEGSSHQFFVQLEFKWTREGVGWEIPIQVHTPTAGPSKLLLPNPELTTVLGVQTLTSDPLCTLWLGMKRFARREIELDRAEDRAEDQAEDGVQDLGEPECYYFEEYEAPRMNPSVVAATRGLDFSKSSTSGKGRP